jgi:hypothetical protein
VTDFIHAIGSDRLGGLIPLDLFLWLPIAALVLLTLQRTGFGRLLYAGRCPLIKIGELRVLASFGPRFERPAMQLDDDVMAKAQAQAAVPFPADGGSRARDVDAATIWGTPQDKPAFR